METTPRRLSPTTVSLIIIATIMVIGLLKAAQVVLLPLVVSAFLAILLSPVIVLLMRRNWPILPAALASLFLVFAIVFLGVFIFTKSLQSLGTEFPLYWERMMGAVRNLDALMRERGFDLELAHFFRSFDLMNLTPVVTKSVGFVVSFMKYGIMIFFITLFMLLEASRLQEKTMRAFGEKNIFSSSMRGIATDIQRYLIVKTAISLATGISVGLFLWFLEVPFPMLWGVITFLLNYIPSVGSIVASIPPILMGLMHPEAPILEALKIGLGLLTIQSILGSYLDPRLMGKNLNLSALIVFMSMVVWGWIWGPAGMLIAVPLTVCMKVVLSYHPRTRPFALMLEG